MKNNKIEIESGNWSKFFNSVYSYLSRKFKFELEGSGSYVMMNCSNKNGL